MDQILDHFKLALQDATLKGALTKDALEHFLAISNELGELKVKHTDLQASNTRLTEVDRLGENDRIQLKSALAIYQKREQELIEREKKMLTLELKAEYETHRRTDTIGLVSLLFRNKEVKESIFSSTPIYEPGYQGSLGSTVHRTKSEEITREEV